MKITMISDTHGQEPVLPGGDLLIHSGDLSIHGFRIEVIRQLNYLHDQLDKYKKIILVPGNHDLFAEKHIQEFREACLMGGIEVLINEATHFQGINIWGSPVTPVYHDWAFNYIDSKRYDLYEKIPEDTQILITHGPPFGILDKNNKQEHIGCKMLLDKVSKINPKLHIFGHCHESNGEVKINNTHFINCATTVTNIVFHK